MSKLNLAEALQFYLDNDLGEIISEKPQNYFVQKEIKKQVEKIVVEQKKSPAETFIKQFARIATEWNALQILVIAGRFANHHNF